jgi:hypothetical protein
MCRREKQCNIEVSCLYTYADMMLAHPTRSLKLSENIDINLSATTYKLADLIVS